MRYALLSLLTALFSSPTLAHDALPHSPHEHEHHQHSLGSHQHGVAQLNIAVQDQWLEIQLIAPSADLLGFEQRPHSAEQHAHMAQVETLLSQATHLFAPSLNAQCQQHDLTLHNPLQHHENSGSLHSDFVVSYSMHCAQPHALKQLGAGALFQQFPSLQRLQLQIIEPSGQRAFELTPQHAELSL